MRNLIVPRTIFDNDLADVFNFFEAPRIKNYIDANLKESKDSYLYSFDIPGVKKDNLDISIDQDFVLIRGERESFESENKKIISTRFNIPKDVNKDAINARHEDGVLYLTLPKKEEVKPRKISLA